MSKQWTPDTWETLCHALAKDKHTEVWVWYGDKEFFTHVRLGEFITKVYYGILKASLEDPRTKKSTVKSAQCFKCVKTMYCYKKEKDYAIHNCEDFTLRTKE